MRRFLLLALALSVILYSHYCDAAWLYSFEGGVSNLFYDGAGILAQERYKIGDRVYAKFYVDFERDGYFILNNGETVIPEDPPLTNDPFWYFYSTLIDGTLLPEINGGMNNGPEDIKEYHIGYYNSGPGPNRGVLRGGHGDSYFSVNKISDLDARVQNWIVGEKLKGIIVAFSDEDWSIMWADMTLTEIRWSPSPNRSIMVLPGILQLLLDF